MFLEIFSAPSNFLETFYVSQKNFLNFFLNFFSSQNDKKLTKKEKNNGRNDRKLARPKGDVERIYRAYAADEVRAR